MTRVALTPVYLSSHRYHVRPRVQLHWFRFNLPRPEDGEHGYGRYRPEPDDELLVSHRRRGGSSSPLAFAWTRIKASISSSERRISLASRKRASPQYGQTSFNRSCSLVSLTILHPDSCEQPLLMYGPRYHQFTPVLLIALPIVDVPPAPTQVERALMDRRFWVTSERMYLAHNAFLEVVFRR